MISDFKKFNNINESDVSQHNTKDKIKKRLDIQEKIEGDSENLKIVRIFLDIAKTTNQWNAFINVKHHSYGKLSYEAHRFYYPTEELIKLIDY
jgi:hypothetical protein